MPESFVKTQVRLVLEQQCHDIAVLLRAHVPAGVHFTVFLADAGLDGNIAYVSTCDRTESIRLVREWLDTRDPHAKVEENDLLRRENSALREKARQAEALFDAVCNGPGEWTDEPTDAELARVGQMKALLTEMAK